jgi:hypothetical protein
VEVEERVARRRVDVAHLAQVATDRQVTTSVVGQGLDLDRALDADVELGKGGGQERVKLGGNVELLHREAGREVSGQTVRAVRGIVTYLDVRRGGRNFVDDMFTDQVPC